MIVHITLTLNLTNKYPFIRGRGRDYTICPRQGPEEKCVSQMFTVTCKLDRIPDTINILLFGEGGGITSFV